MIRSLTRKAGKRTVRAVISPKIRANAIREVNRNPYRYEGIFRGLEFVLYRQIGQIGLLVRNGKHWKQMTESTVWSALDAVEKERNYANTDATPETVDRSQDGGTGCADQGGTGRQAAAEPPAQEAHAPRKVKAAPAGSGGGQDAAR